MLVWGRLHIYYVLYSTCIMYIRLVAGSDAGRFPRGADSPANGPN